MATYDSPAEGLSRQHEDLPRPRMTKTRLGLLPEAERTGEEPDPMKIFQEFLQASIDATTSQQQLVKEERKVEKTAKKLAALNQKAWIAWKAYYKGYKQSNGKDNMVEMMEPDVQEYCAEYICEIELKEFLLLENSEISDILDNNFDISTANYYETTLKALYMEPKNFSREDVEDYCMAFLGALTKNPNFTDPDSGGTSPKVINKMFLKGLQTSHFRERIEKHDTETVTATLAAIKKVLPKYQESIAMDMVPLVRSTPPQLAMVKARQSTSSSTTSAAGSAPFKSQQHTCQNCNQPGHRYAKCPSKCVRCPPGTPVHDYWHNSECKYRQVKFPEWQARQNKQPKANVVVVPTTPDAGAALIALQAKFDAMVARCESLEEALNVKNKLKILDSGANTCIISDVTHVDTNTVPFCRRAEDGAGVETASGAVMPITSRGVICGLEGPICPSATTSLVSAQQLCTEGNAFVIMDSVGAIAVKKDVENTRLINLIKMNSPTPLLSATLNTQSLYEITSTSPYIPLNDQLPLVSDTLLEPTSIATGDTAAWSPSPELIERHQRWNSYYNKALASFYNTAEFQTHRDLVRFFHEAWDHPSRELMCKIVDSKSFDNIPKDLTSKRIRKHFPHCEACPANNMAQRPIPTTATERVIEPGAEFQVDIKVFANNGKALKHKRAFGRYTGALTAIDMSTRFKIGTLIRSHANLDTHLEALRVEIHGTGHTLKVLRLDNEFMTQDIKTWAAKCEPPIQLQPCIPHEHHSIGDIEKFNQTLENNVNKKLYGKSHLSVQYWGLAYQDYIDKANLMGSVHGPTQSPYELWTGQKPDLDKFPMIPFGSVVMAHVPLKQQEVGSPKAILHYAVGTSMGHRGGMRLWNPKTKREIVRHTYKTIGITPPTQTRPEYELAENGEVTIMPVSQDTTTISNDVDDYKYLIGTLHRDVDYELELFKTVDVVEETFDVEEGPIIVAYRRRVTETGKLLPLTEDDEYSYQIQDIVQMTAEYAKDNPVKTTNNPKTVRVKLTSLLCNISSTSSRLSSQQANDYWKNHLPRSITQVLSMPQDHPDRAGFLAATAAEIKSLRDMETWDTTEVLSPEQMKISGIGMSRCVFTKKYHPDGTFDKYKCRIVFRGDRWYDLYCNKTYAGCVMSESVRLLLSVAATEDMEVASLDVKTAFLYGIIPLVQFIYMRRPAGLTDVDMPAVIRLRKCIYGLPHAPATFREHSDRNLRSFGFTPTVSDPRLYVRLLADGTKAYVAVHVDDFGIAASTPELKAETMAAIRTVYNCVEGDLGYYLGMQLVRDRVKRTITISQPGYLEDLREQFGITSTHGPLTPMVDKEREPESESNPRLDAAGIKLFQSKVGSILWPAVGTRPEILFATNMHSRQTKSPLRGDMLTVDRVLDYLVNTPDLGLVLGGLGGVVLYATVDASYGTHDDRKSHSGCTLHIGEGSGAFLSRSKKQTVTADSSTVAEFIATHLVSKEIMWARALLEEMGFAQDTPTVLGEDNMSTIHMINNDCNGQKTKHIAIRFNLIREQVKSLAIQLEHLPTKEMTSDILTKALDPKPFAHLRKKLLGMVGITV